MSSGVTFQAHCISMFLYVCFWSPSFSASCRLVLTHMSEPFCRLAVFHLQPNGAEQPEIKCIDDDPEAPMTNDDVITWLAKVEYILVGPEPNIWMPQLDSNKVNQD